jgi:hypothetical protein
LEFFDEGHDVDDVEDVALDCADWILKRGKGESATAEGEFSKGYFFDCFLAFPIFLHLGVGDVHLILGVSVFPHSLII